MATTQRRTAPRSFDEVFRSIADVDGGECSSDRIRERTPLQALFFDSVSEIATRIQAREIDRGAYELSGALRSCFDAAVETAKILRVLVHADDVDAARSVVETASAENGIREAPRVEPDSRVTRGTCIVVTDAGRFRHDPRAMLEDAIVRMGQAVRA